jgi:hypothetical protein
MQGKTVAVLNEFQKPVGKVCGAVMLPTGFILPGHRHVAASKSQEVQIRRFQAQCAQAV